MVKQGYENCNSEKNIFTMPCEGNHGNTSEDPKSINRQPITSKREVAKEVDNRNTTSEDDSDTEVYRFKRRSSTKVEKQIIHDSVSSTDQQVNIPYVLRGWM